MPPCFTTNLGGPDFNNTEDVYKMRHLNATGTTETSTTADDKYDQVGALQFIICTVLVYSFLGVFFLLVIRFRQGTTAHQSARTEADAINNYLKSERSLKLQGCKMKMLTEIEKHAENIRIYEEKLKLLEIKEDIKSKDFGFPDEIKRKDSRSFRTGRKKHKHTGSRISSPGRRRLSTPEAFGRMGFSFLFMESREEAIEEEEELNDEKTKSDEKFTKSKTLPKSKSFHARSAIDLEAENGVDDLQYIDT